MFVIFPFIGFEVGIWDFIVLMADHFLSRLLCKRLIRKNTKVALKLKRIK